MAHTERFSGAERSDGDDPCYHNRVTTSSRLFFLAFTFAAALPTVVACAEASTARPQVGESTLTGGASSTASGGGGGMLVGGAGAQLSTAPGGAGSSAQGGSAARGGAAAQAGAATQGGAGATANGGLGGGEPLGGQAAGSGGAGGGQSAPGGFTCPADAGTLDLAGAKAEPVSDAVPTGGFGNGFSILEGPVWSGDALYFSQISNDGPPPGARILKIVPGMPGGVFMEESGSNGLALDSTGGLLAARHADGSVSKIDLATKMLTVVAGMNMGARFNSPNDIAIRSDGNLYFSDPTWQAPMPAPQSATRVYRVDASGSVTIAVEGAQQPNGVTLSLDEAALYVSGQGPLKKHPIAADGSVGEGAQFGNVFAGDGMVIDCAGNLYVTNNANVTVLDSAGAELGSISIQGSQAATNVAFGGSGRKTLYITTLDSAPKLYKVELGIVGYPF